MLAMQTTWDGLPVAREQPYACCVVVWRQSGRGREFLVLHRLAPGGAGYEGDWAWTPPSGARLPGETPDAAAARELHEETSLALDLVALPEAAPSEDVAVYVAEAPAGAEIDLDDEHDRFLWLPLEESVPKCLPAAVAACLVNASAWLDARAGAERS